MNSLLGPKLSGLINLLFPNRCAFCAAVLEEGCSICERCIAGIELISGPVCGRCGAPSPDPLTGKRHSRVQCCEQCRDMVAVFHKNESLSVFTGKMRELIHHFKFNKRRSLSNLFSGLLVKHKRDYILEHDELVPVPLTGVRMLERGFNQSLLIARKLASRLPVGFHGSIISRKGDSVPQSRVRSRAQRRNNINDRFFVKKRWRTVVPGKRVLLFDDVLTTGATASECARVLYEEGAVCVNLLTLSRAMVNSIDI